MFFLGSCVHPFAQAAWHFLPGMSFFFAMLRKGAGSETFAFGIRFPQRKGPADFLVTVGPLNGVQFRPGRGFARYIRFRACGGFDRSAQTGKLFLRKAFGPEGDVHKAWGKRLAGHCSCGEKGGKFSMIQAMYRVLFT